MSNPRFSSIQLLAVAIIFLIIGGVIGYFASQTTVSKGPTTTVTVTTTKTVSGAAPTPEYTFYFISHGGPGDPFWRVVMKGAETAGQLLNVKVIYMGPQKYSVKWLVDALESAAAAKPDGIIITVTDYSALDKPLRRVIQQGIPVIAVNINDPRPESERIPYLSYVGQNEYDAGYKLGKYVIEWFKQNKGRLPKYAFISIHEAGHVGLELRAKGIQDAFKEAGANYVPEKVYTSTDMTKIYEIVKSYVESHPDTEVIFTLGPLDAHPVIRFIKEQGLKGKVYHATMDITDTILDGIREGITIAANSQQPFAQGFWSVVFMYTYVKYGIRPPEHVPTGPTIVDKNTLSMIEKQIKTCGGA